MQSFQCRISRHELISLSRSPFSWTSLPFYYCDRTSSKRKGSWANSSPLARRSFAVSYSLRCSHSCKHWRPSHHVIHRLGIWVSLSTCKLLSSTLRSFTASSPFCLDLIFCWQHPHVHNVCGWNAFHDPLWLVWKPSTHIWPHLGPISAWVRAQVVPAGLRTLWRILSGPCRCRCHHLRRFFLVETWVGTGRNPRLFTGKNTPLHQV